MGYYMGGPCRYSDFRVLIHINWKNCHVYLIYVDEHCHAGRYADTTALGLDEVGVKTNPKSGKVRRVCRATLRDCNAP